MIVDTERVTDGFPSTYEMDRTVTVSLALALDRRVEARALLPGAVIILPIERFPEWDDSKLRQIIRHELAHIAVSDFLGPPSWEIPRWFDEGFAEWAAGGLRPEGRVLVEIEVRRRTRAGEPMPVLADALQNLPRRMAHDFFASIFEFLEIAKERSIKDGELLRNIKQHGMSTGFRKTFNATLEELEAAWHQWLIQEFH